MGSWQSGCCLHPLPFLSGVALARGWYCPCSEHNNWLSELPGPTLGLPSSALLCQGPLSPTYPSLPRLPPFFWGWPGSGSLCLVFLETWRKMGENIKCVPLRNKALIKRFNSWSECLRRDSHVMVVVEEALWLFSFQELYLYLFWRVKGRELLFTNWLTYYCSFWKNPDNFTLPLQRGKMEAPENLSNFSRTKPFENTRFWQKPSPFCVRGSGLPTLSHGGSGKR